MEITLDLPENLAAELHPVEEQLPKILELGLREWNASGSSEFEGVSDVLEVLAGLPEPEEILALRPSEKFQNRISSMLEKNRAEGLNATEEREWQAYQFIEHLVRIAKAKAHMKLKNASDE
ncbi:MAG: hypothetical protein QF473_00065 [Planctomycetota bacterium]|jgi:hypothetical protein|nr:hypothetical protein [Planctomycetota bacterium]MDP6502006.1 hypothetical protein [Planctomycetota bacterium]